MQSYGPNALGGNEPTGLVPIHPFAPIFLYGNFPRHVFAMTTPSGSLVVPQAYGDGREPPPAAYSSSASVGSRPPTHSAYASASAYAMCTTGCFGRSFELGPTPGPLGTRQCAPGTHRHH